MICTCARQGEQGFHRVKPAHAVARLAARSKFADMIMAIVLAAEKITIQRQNYLCLVEIEYRLHRLAKCLRRRALMDAGINRIIGEPFRLRKFLCDDFLQPRTRRRSAAFREEGQTFTAVGGKLFRKFVEET